MHLSIKSTAMTIKASYVLISNIFKKWSHNRSSAPCLLKPFALPIPMTLWLNVMTDYFPRHFSHLNSFNLQWRINSFSRVSEQIPWKYHAYFPCSVSITCLISQSVSYIITHTVCDCGNMHLWKWLDGAVRESMHWCSLSLDDRLSRNNYGPIDLSGGLAWSDG